MKLHSLFCIVFLLGKIAPDAFAAKIKRTPEEESVYLGKILKPIPDDQWRTIAGHQLTERYEVIKGDTLFDISGRLFGDARYWPKIWAINNNNITNPHRIKPGDIVVFSAGTGNSLPSVAILASNDDANSNSDQMSDIPPPTVKIKKKFRSNDWKRLPPQPWESYQEPLPPEIDPLGFDTRNKILFHAPTGVDPEAISSTDKLKILGQIIGSRSEGNQLAMNETVYIRTDDNLQVGDTYSITQEPGLLKSPRSDRVGYAYPILGQVKILGVRDNLFVGVVQKGADFIPRGSYLIPLVPRIPVLTPIPGPSPIQGIMMLDKTISTPMAAQHKTVFVDRGSDDGIKPGMVFRAYEHYDPGNGKKLTAANFIIDGDLLVTQVSETFCTAVVLRSLSALFENSPVTLLTDISDLTKNPSFKSKGDENDLDDLDKLDSDETLGRDERRVLKQLEKWKGNPAGTAPPPTTDVSSPPPEEGTTPPPPESPEQVRPEAPSVPDAPPPDASPPTAPEPAAPTPPASTELTEPPPPVVTSDVPPPSDDFPTPPKD